jgi:hypothetical protein
MALTGLRCLGPVAPELGVFGYYWSWPASAGAEPGRLSPFNLNLEDIPQAKPCPPVERCLGTCRTNSDEPRNAYCSRGRTYLISHPTLRTEPKDNVPAPLFARALVLDWQKRSTSNREPNKEGRYRSRYIESAVTRSRLRLLWKYIHT